MILRSVFLTVASYSLLCVTEGFAFDLKTDLRAARQALRHDASADALNATSDAPQRLDVSFTSTQVVGSRTYHIIRPLEDAGKQTSLRPVVLMFHGFGSDAAAFSLETTLPEEAPKRGYVLAYLDGSPKESTDVPSQRRMWNTGSAGGRAAAEHVNDVDFTASVVQELVQKHGVDPQRVFLAGLSNGASMAVRMACEKPELFAGVVAAHGSLEFRNGDECGKDCSPETSYCSWDSEKGNCKQSDWAEKLPHIFECSKLKDKKMPMLFINGETAPGTSPEGSVYAPNTTEAESFPPVTYMFDYFAGLYGCSGNKVEDLVNSSSNDWTKCTSYDNCQLKTCMSSAGDWWYGDDYDIPKVCLYTGGTEDGCSREKQFVHWGNNTNTMRLSPQTLDFFDKASSKSVQKSGKSGR